MFFGQGFPGFGDENASSQSSDVDTQALYDSLGVSKTATTDEINKAFRNLARKHHPDKGGDSEKFKEIKAAHEVLSNPEKRDLYDRYGLDAVRGEGGGPDPFEGLFGGLFGRQKQSGPKKVRPMVVEIQVTLEDLYLGKMREVSYERHKVCEGCQGKGGEDAKKCTKCNGQGMVQKLVQLGPGFMSQTTAPCPDCKGEGNIFDAAKICKKCKGEKIIKETKKIEVPIEQGAPNDHHIVFTGEGNEIPDALPGDLVVKFVYREHPEFTRKGADLYYKKKISLYEALTGCIVQIKHLDGKVINLTTEPGDIINPGMRKQVKGKGMPFYKDTMSHGFLYIDFEIEFPKKGDLKNIDDLKKILPLPKNVPTVDKKNCIAMEAFEKETMNSKAEGGNRRNGEYEEDDDDEMPRGQRVQCAQQ